MVKQFLRDFALDAIYGIDMETHWAADYTLRKMATTEYVLDPRFLVQCVSVQRHDWKRAKVLSLAEFSAWAKWFRNERQGWRTGILAHHTQFDGLILAHHFGVKPALWLDTMSMARPVMPVTIRRGLDPLCRAFGLTGKVGGEALENVKGKRELSHEEYIRLAKYAGNDIEQTWQLFRKLLPFTQRDELRLIDLTVRMYTEPSVLINRVLTDEIVRTEIERKADLIKRLGVDRADLMSNPRFAQLLRNAGVDPPMKISKRTKLPALASSRNDLAFKALLTHPDRRVRGLVEARMAVKSTQMEKRSARFSSRADHGAQPIYLNYWGASTGRWSGGDKMNWQNLNRKSDLRRSITAPVNARFLIADQSQIEARLNAWMSGQTNIVEAFRAGDDVYKLAASIVFNIPVDDVTEDQRFVGKVMVLALGYQAGAPRFADMLRLGQYAPPIDVTDEQAATWHSAWRQANNAIVRNWYTTQDAVIPAFLSQRRTEYKGLVFEGANGNGFIHLPNGTSLRYDKLEVDGENNLTYISEVSGHRTKIYGGHMVENIMQALARAILAKQLLAIHEQLPRAKIATTTHDETLVVCNKRYVATYRDRLEKIMTTPPVWAPDLPCAVKIQVSTIYNKDD